MSSRSDLFTAQPGERFETACGPVTTPQLVRYAGASGDFNPIHYDHHYAVEAKLGGVIAHGMLTMAFMGRALTDRAGAGGRVARISARFTAPVRPGDMVLAAATVAGRRESPEAVELECDLSAHVGDRQVAEGRATVIWPSGAAGRSATGGRHG